MKAWFASLALVVGANLVAADVQPQPSKTGAAASSSPTTLAIEKQYLHWPVKNGAPKIAFEVLDGGTVVRRLQIELALDSAPDWWASDEVSEFRGKPLTLRGVGGAPEAAVKELGRLLRQSDEPGLDKALYQEPLRPQFHFTARHGWNNDPNGLVYFNGEYHLFFQQLPYGIVGRDFGHMHWGHAVSPDLFHWTELRPAIYPLKGGAFSGGAFVDHGNRFGFGTGNEDVLLASFTGAGECLAVGTGRALALKELPGNPVLKHRGRDPKVIRYEPQHKWVMIVYEEERDQPSGYAFYESKDLKAWNKLCFVEGGHECPDLFEMPVEGESTRKWVIYGAVRRPMPGGNATFMRSAYRVGTFDGNAFTPETDFIRGLTGPSFYAAQTFTDAPGGRRILMGWLQGATYPGMPFTQGMTVPMDMKLRRTPEGLRMSFTPAREIEGLRARTFNGKDMSVSEANAVLAKAGGELLDLDLEVATGASGKLVLSARGNSVVWDAGANNLSCRTHKATLAGSDGRLQLRVLVDRCVLELFANDGRTGMTFGGNIFSNTAPLKLEGGPETRVVSLRVSELNSAWAARK